MFLIVGLGNPEDKYKDTRHNLGFEAVEELGKRMGGGAWEVEKKFKSEILKIAYNLQPISYNLILAKPQTYMNNSGIAVTLIANYFKIRPEDIIILHDDLDLPLGKIKIRLGGAAAGHHGVESIISHLGTDKFIRIRMGIGNLRSISGEHHTGSFNAESFVINKFLPSEKSKVKKMMKQAVKAFELLLGEGLEKAQNQFN